MQVGGVGERVGHMQWWFPGVSVARHWAIVGLGGWRGRGEGAWLVVLLCVCACSGSRASAGVLTCGLPPLDDNGGGFWYHLSTDDTRAWWKWRRTVVHGGRGKGRSCDRGRDKDAGIRGGRPSAARDAVCKGDQAQHKKKQRIL